MSGNTLDIKLLGKDYRVACPPEERESLQAAVDLLDERMGEMATKSKSTGERLAVMTALNLAHELLSQKNPGAGVDRYDLKRRISAMEARLDEALALQEKLF
ncbi:cell division protein ZapA [Sulfurisoma sediminicola]|uniref:Cell division protein ZapA n=1 Tax=Sulfurisoma sediminicola TaxID=1381557 RepID=A0A497XKD5_9PROT|nr:cell division protein ZapA [Sulfurisoma sediminicola]RLJ68334.1 cell division protein ZapA [Sulfurisoma sediminicola]